MNGTRSQNTKQNEIENIKTSHQVIRQTTTKTMATTTIKNNNLKTMKNK